MLNHFVDYKRFIHISYHILEFVQQKKTKLAMEQCYILHIYCQYHVCWCPGDCRSQGISRNYIDPPKLQYSISSIRRVYTIQLLLLLKCQAFHTSLNELVWFSHLNQLHTTCSLWYWYGISLIWNAWDFYHNRFYWNGSVVNMTWSSLIQYFYMNSNKFVHNSRLPRDQSITSTNDLLSVGPLITN